MRLRILEDSHEEEDQYFEGFFILARSNGDDDVSHGTFDVLGDPDMMPLSCFGENNVSRWKPIKSKIRVL